MKFSPSKTERNAHKAHTKCTYLAERCAGYLQLPGPKEQQKARPCPLPCTYLLKHQKKAKNWLFSRTYEPERDNYYLVGTGALIRFPLGREQRMRIVQRWARLSPGAATARLLAAGYLCRPRIQSQSEFKINRGDTLRGIHFFPGPSFVLAARTFFASDAAVMIYK